MTENLTEQYKDYAVYLPSLQQQYANLSWPPKTVPLFVD